MICIVSCMNLCLGVKYLKHEYIFIIGLPIWGLFILYYSQTDKYADFTSFPYHCTAFNILHNLDPVLHQWPILLTWFNFNLSMDK